MGSERRIVLYEGTNLEEAKEARDFLDENEVNYSLGFGDLARSQDSSFPIVSIGMMDLYGLEAIERHSFR